MTERSTGASSTRTFSSSVREVENAPSTDACSSRKSVGLRAFWVARGGYIEASTIHSEVIEVPRDTIGFHVYEFEDKLRTNFGETQATLVDLGSQRMDAEVNLRVLRLFQAAIPSTSPYYISGPAWRSALNTGTARGAGRVERPDGDDHRPGHDDGADRRRSSWAPGPTGPGSSRRPTSSCSQGVLGVYRGARIITLKNYQDDSDAAVLPGQRAVRHRPRRQQVRLLGRAPVQGVHRGRQLVLALPRTARLRRHRAPPDRMRRIVDTSTAP
jgi:hypothetical protein